MKKYIPLALVLSLYLFTRLFRITEIPASVYWDEASIGYNAYSITQDLRDEWGEFMPLHFRAFGEFKLPVYIYSTAVFVKLFGLSVFSVRIASVAFGLSAIIFTYLITFRITKDQATSDMAAFVLTLSPFAFIFSRTGYEAVAGLAFYLAGVYFFLESEKKSNLFFITTLAWVLSAYSYNSFRIIVPISLVLVSIRIYLDKKKLLYKPLVISILIFVISIIPIIQVTTKDHGAFRLAAVAVEGANTVEKVVNTSKNYMSHFSPNFLFLEGESNPRSQIPGFGQLYLIDLPLLLFGLWIILKKRKTKYLLPLILLLIAPIPAAITREAPHALRSILMAPMLAIISAIGVSAFFKQNNYKVILYGVIAVYLISFGNYWNTFLNDYNKLTSEAWQYQYKELFTSYEFKESNNINITDEYAQPYIFALFYQKYNPEKFRETVSYNAPDKWGFSTVDSYGRYNFTKDFSTAQRDGIIVAGISTKLNEESDDVIKLIDSTNSLYIYK